MTFTPAELLTLARVQRYQSGSLFSLSRGHELPPTWKAGESNRNPFSPTTGTNFYSVRDRFDVVAFKGVEIMDIRDVVGVPLKRHFGYSPVGLNFAKSVVERVRPAALTRTVIIGHSGGGGLASYVAALLNLPSVVFNSGRVSPGKNTGDRHSFINDGTKQTVIYVEGDRWSDPEENPRLGPMLPGQVIKLVLPPSPDGKRRVMDTEHGKHSMDTVVTLLAALAA